MSCWNHEVKTYIRVTWCFLQLADLLVREGATIVDQGDRVLGATTHVRTHCGFTNAPMLILGFFGSTADVTSEKGRLHIGNYR